jgi:molybdenum cofactor biosynthesis protein B
MSAEPDPVHAHRQQAPSRIACGVLTISDTRTPEDDRSGDAIQAALEAAGHELVARRIVKDDPEAIGLAVQELATAARAVITTGGTGLTARDSTFEVLSGLIERPIPGFGELFRALSFEEIGSAAMLSRALAGVLPGGAVVFALPGSSKAVRLGLERLIVPELGHVLEQLGR